MGLFSFVGKAIGKIAKTGLSIVTHGVSDKVLAVLKSRGDAKAAAAREQQTLQQLALAEKIRPLQARVRTTSTIIDDATEPIQPRAKSKAEIYGRLGYSFSAAKRALLGGSTDPTIPTAARAPVRRSAIKKRPAPRPVAPAPAKRAAGRSVPSGGLDLKRISAMWSAAGKPGKWLDFIKANSGVRKS